MDKEFEQYLINNKIPYKQLGNNKITLSTIDSVNGNRHRFVVDLNTGDSTNDPFAHPGPVSWKVTKDTDGYILKGVNSMYRDQLLTPSKKEDPQLYEVIERITSPKKVVTSNKPKSTSTVTKSTGTKSASTKKYKRTIYDSEGNVVSQEDFYPTKEDLDTLSQRLGQRTPVSLEKGDKIENAMEDWIIEFIKRNEDFIPAAKILKGETHPTVGYGTYQYYANGKPVKEGDTITKEAAEQQILQYINKVMPEVYRYFPEFDNYPSQMKGAIIDTIYRGGGTSLKNSPAFVGAVNKGFEDKKFSAKELAAIVKEMGLKIVDPEKDSPSNLNDRKERRAAMMYGIYNTEHDNSIRSLGGKGAKTTPYTNFHINVQKPGTMWNTVYRSTESHKQGGKLSYLDIF